MNSGTRPEPSPNRRRSSILVTAHADSVFSADTPHVLNVGPDSIAGPGIADNAIGLAAVVGLPSTDTWESVSRTTCCYSPTFAVWVGNLEAAGPSSKPSSDRFERNLCGRSDPGTAQLFRTRCCEAKSPFEYRAITTGKDSVQPVQSVT